MFGLDVFLVGLLVVSTLTGLVTEGVKKILIEYEINYKANTMAGVVALFISALAGLGYVIFTNTAITGQVTRSLGVYGLLGDLNQQCIAYVALVFMSWLSAMVGYDKVIQAINQFKNN